MAQPRTTSESPTTTLVVFAVTLIVGAVASVLLAPLGLAVPEYAVWPLSISFGALVGSLAAVWASNLIVSDGSRSNLPYVVAMSVLVGGVVGLGTLALTGSGIFLLNRAVTLAVVMVLVAYIASSISLRYRTPERSTRFDMTLTILLLVAGVGAVAGAVVAVCSVDRCVA